MWWRREWQPAPVSLPGESPWTEEPGGLQSMGLHRVGDDWVTYPLNVNTSTRELSGRHARHCWKTSPAANNKESRYKGKWKSNKETETCRRHGEVLKRNANFQNEKENRNMPCIYKCFFFLKFKMNFYFNIPRTRWFYITESTFCMFILFTFFISII